MEDRDRRPKILGNKAQFNTLFPVCVDISLTTAFVNRLVAEALKVVVVARLFGCLSETLVKKKMVRVVIPSHVPAPTSLS